MKEVESMKEIKIEWCKNFIAKTFAKLPAGITGIETNCFFEMAEKSSLYVKGTYGTPMNNALSELVFVDTVFNANDEYAYSVFRLAK